MWKIQVTPYLKANGLFSYADGSTPQPPALVDGKANPQYAEWVKKDQLVMSILTASLSEPVLAQIIECSTAADIWSTLHELFAARSSAQVVHTRLQLASLKKGGESVTEFFNKAKGLVSLLAGARQSVSDEEFSTFFWQD